MQPCSWVYNEREDSWPTSTTEFCLITPRSNACAAAINGKIYVAGELAVKTSALPRTGLVAVSRNRVNLSMSSISSMTRIHSQCPSCTSSHTLDIRISEGSDHLSERISQNRTQQFVDIV